MQFNIKQILLLAFIYCFTSSYSYTQANVKQISYWPNKKKKSMGVMVDSVKLGEWQYWNEDGSPGDSGAYVKLTPENIRIYIEQEYMDKYKLDTLKIKKESANLYRYINSGKWVFRTETGGITEEGEYLPVAYISIDFMLDENYEEIYVYGAPQPIKTGVWKFYCESGKLDAEQVYQMGEKYGYGNRIEYYPSGIKKKEGIFHEDHFHWSGPVKFYNENGKLVKVVTYTEHGEEIKVENY